MTLEATQPSAPRKLTEWTSCGGCAAKWGGAPLTSLLKDLAGEPDADVLFGLAPFDDAAVYRLSPEAALVSTTDFFPPLVDDPADFGAIAASNACSDVFAMGGRVLVALNIAAFPEDFPSETIATIFVSAAEVVRAAGGTVAGGHTIRSAEPIFGLAVQGLVHPQRIWHKGGARAGDRLLLSKPIGSGIVLAGGTPDDKAAAVAVMRVLNLEAADQLHCLASADGTSGVHAVTDVTGFGLAGHGWEMAERSGVTVRLFARNVPLYPGALAAAAAGIRTGGDARNRAYLAGRFANEASAPMEGLALDPQTSGGLLAAVSPELAPALVTQGWWPIGDIAAGPPLVILTDDPLS
jgi:selenide,water dikinase